jgi:hypothetical protein
LGGRVPVDGRELEIRLRVSAFIRLLIVKKCIEGGKKREEGLMIDIDYS